MIPNLASPSICVIDDEKPDYEPILAALFKLGLGCVHVKGDLKTSLPRTPFKSLRVVFTDLHLTTKVGKDAASHTANVFSKVVSLETAPVVVVIWSKYKDDIVEDGPEDDQPTEAELFKSTLLESFPDFNERLVFIEMAKPKPKDRPSAARWITQLQRDIRKGLGSVNAFDVLWAWESLVRDAGMRVTEGLTSLAALPDLVAEAGPPKTLHQKLELALRLLVRQQGGEGSALAAPRHLTSVLGQSLIDYLEPADERKDLARHGLWLSDQNDLPKTSSIGPGVNAFLLTSALDKTRKPFVPGTIYRVSKREKFEEVFGSKIETLLADCYGGSPANFEAWKISNPTLPVLIELTPECDVHQGSRKNALLIGGLILPAAARKKIKRADSIEFFPTFSLRWTIKDFKEESVFLAFFSRLKVTVGQKREPRWLVPWFRLRELPTASLRNWHASQASRVGYVSL